MKGERKLNMHYDINPDIEQIAFLKIYYIKQN